MDRHRRRTDRIPKLIGSDIEVGNFIMGRPTERGTGGDAAVLLLRRVDGFPRGSTSTVGQQPTTIWPTVPFGYREPVWGSGTAGYPTGPSNEPAREFNPRDWARRYLSSNGGCVYIDLDHLELCTPEVLSAHDFVAASRAMLWIARDALQAANTHRRTDERLVVLANNSDGRGNSYGSHFSFLVSRSLWTRLFERPLYPDLFTLATFQASAIVFAGQGKVGSENGRSPVSYQVSQRADFIETLLGPQTTRRRPLMNTRDEALCGPSWLDRRPDHPSRRLARLHCIAFDHTLCEVATLLKMGTMQIVLAMLEAGWLERPVVVDDPVGAVHRWSHGADLRATARSGRRWLSMVDVQSEFLNRARVFVDRGECEANVPDAKHILQLWEETLALLEARDFDALRSRLDWVLKRSLLERARAGRPDLGWDSNPMKHLDFIYGSLEETEGLFWACDRAGVVERVVTPAEIERFVHEPPDDTRAWMRAHLLRTLDPDAIQDVTWDEIRFRAERADTSRIIRLDDPLGFTRGALERQVPRPRPWGRAATAPDRPPDTTVDAHETARPPLTPREES